MPSTPDFLTKFAGEHRVYGIDFAANLGSDTISSITSVTATPSGLTVGTPFISTTQVGFLLTSGSPGVTYEVLATIVTSSGQILEETGLLQIIS